MKKGSASRQWVSGLYYAASIVLKGFLLEHWRKMAINMCLFLFVFLKSAYLSM